VSGIYPLADAFLFNASCVHKLSNDDQIVFSLTGLIFEITRNIAKRT
jgi:hypothetical protein